MTKKVKTEEELGKALKNKEDFIEIEGDLANKVFKIRATGFVAWGVAIGAIGIAFYSVIATIGSAGAAVPGTAITAGLSGTAAASILGGTVAYSAIAIAVAAGGIGFLTSLRNYEQVTRSKNYLVLKRR